MGIDGVELGRFDEGVGDCGSFAARFGVDKEVILPSEGYGVHAEFGGIVLELKNAVVG